jgi:hypothetical protein
MTTPPAPQRKPRRRSGPGYTIPAFSERYGISIGTVRRAVRDKQITTVTFGGRNLITPAEAERIAKLFSLTPKEGNSHGEHSEDQNQERH